MERLQKILSQAGIASRRASEQADARRPRHGQRHDRSASWAPRPTRRATTSGSTAAASRFAERHLYLLLNKPRGYVTTRSDPQKRPTVIDLLKGVREYVYPVGRLDYDSEGLLILTNDGDLAARLTHPRHGVPRVYEAQRARRARRARSEAAGERRDDRGRTDRAGRGRVARTEPAAHHRPRRTQPSGAEDVRRHRPSGRRSCGASPSARFATRG